MTDLLSLVLTLRPLEAASELPHVGRAAHAILLEAIRQADAPLANALHNGSDLRPFTASDLIGRRGPGVSLEHTYTLRLTTLNAPVSQAVLAATQPSGSLAPGATVRLMDMRFRIEALSTGQPAASDLASNSDGRASTHPWAMATTYEALSAPWLLGGAAPEPRLDLYFASPTTFKSGGRHVPVPLPAWVFGSLLEKWNAFAPVALPPEARRFAEECLALTAYRLRTYTTLLKDGGMRVGAVGQARYTALNRDRYWLSVMHLLGDFALFAGVGVGASMGLGQVRRVQDNVGVEGR
jgi:CRISPR-associated endoribonuclease Cas6